MMSYDVSRFDTMYSEFFETVKAELSAGCKQSHWMWFIFPQIQGLGLSESSMTLFSVVQPENPVFQQMLDKFFAGVSDEKTLNIMREL